MNPIHYNIKDLSQTEFYEQHLKIVTAVLPGNITPTEIVVLANFMALKGDAIEQDRFCSSARKIVMGALEMSPGGLGNHFKSLLLKKYLKKEGRKMFINKYLIPDNDSSQGYQFKIERNE